jgi:hypothetical protein
MHFVQRICKNDEGKMLQDTYKEMTQSGTKGNEIRKASRKKQVTMQCDTNNLIFSKHTKQLNIFEVNISQYFCLQQTEKYIHTLHFTFNQEERCYKQVEVVCQHRLWTTEEIR